MNALSDAPEPEIVAAAREMGVDPVSLRAQLDAADFTPPSPDQTDDLPKLLARLDEPVSPLPGQGPLDGLDVS